MQPPQQTAGQQPQHSMGSQPMGPQSYYYGQAGPMHLLPPMLLKKRMVFLVVAVGALLIWIGQVSFFGFGVRDSGSLNALRALFLTGALIGSGASTLGALGSPRTDSYQNLGLLVLAGFFVLALVNGPRF